MFEIKANLIFNVLIFVLGIAAIYSFQYIKPKNKITIRKNRYKQFKNLVENNITTNKVVDNIMNELDIGLSFQKYQIIRWALFIIILLLYVSNAVAKGGTIPQNQLLLLIGTFIVTTPRVSILGKKTPFIYVLEFVAIEMRKERNIEIYRAISQLKNLSIAKQNNPPGSDFILEQLRKFSKKTRPIWNQTMYLWSMGKKEEACQYFSNKIGTPEGEELANLFSKLDELNPIELKNQLILFQDKIKKQRETEKLKSNENKSYMIYAIVIASAFIIILNFVIVGYYIDTINLYKYQM